MFNIRLFFNRLGHSTHARKAGRTQLKAAKNGDREQFLALSATYLNVAVTYFASSISEDAETRTRRTVQLFERLWQNIRYTERLSDFEYMLARSLMESAPKNGPITSSDPLVTKLRLLAPDVRFAVIACKFENWPRRWVALALRIRIPKLHRMLSEARCELCGIGWESLANEEKSCLQAISESLEKCPNMRINRELNARIKSFPRVASIKAQWLELRSELVEVRLRYLLDQKEREHLLDRILESVAETPSPRPPLVDRVVNTVHFSRHGQIKVS